MIGLFLCIFLTLFVLVLGTMGGGNNKGGPNW